MFGFHPSQIPHHKSPEYDSWRCHFTAELMQELQYYCMSHTQEYEDVLRFTLEFKTHTKLPKLDLWQHKSVTATFGCEVNADLYEFAARYIRSGEIIVIGEMVDQLPDLWLITPHEIMMGYLPSSQIMAKINRQTAGGTGESPISSSPPKTEPIPALIGIPKTPRKLTNTLL